MALDGARVALGSFEDYARLYAGAGRGGGAAPAAAHDSDSDGDTDTESDTDTEGAKSVVAAGKQPAAGEGDDLLYIRVNKRWEVAVCATPLGGAANPSFAQVSFVNAMHTARGGSHVSLVADQLAHRLSDAINKRLARGSSGVGGGAGAGNNALPRGVTPAMVKQHLMVFVNCLVENPSFDSQAKEKLTTPPNRFGSRCVFPDRFNRELARRSGVVERAAAWAELRQRQLLLRQSARLTKGRGREILSIPKLEDANFAGSKKPDGAARGGGARPRSRGCTLILTEGDSAKALAVAGLEVVGRDRYGAFPLKGKPLNVRDASTKQVMDNVEVRRLCTILGLDFNKTYETEAEHVF